MIFKLNVKTTIHIISLIVSIFLALIIYQGYQLGIFSSMDTLHHYVESAGVLGPLLFIGIQLVQVVIPVIPGGVSCVAGIILFGPLWGFVYNYIGIILGSIINFALARYYGHRFIRSMVSDKLYHKYISWLEKDKHFEKFFAIAIFLPIAPDDFLCMLAGLTQMTYRKFTTILLLGKPASLLVYSLGLTTLFEQTLHLIFN